jgi:hypothetical protein
MANPYTFIDSNTNFEITNIYDLIDSYFDYPILEKVKNEKGISVYMCKLKTLLGGIDQRYLIVICKEDSLPLQTRLKLSNISWINFQARTLKEDRGIRTYHSYTPKTTDEYKLPVSLKQRYEDHTDYNMNNYPHITVTLLHKTKNLYQYPDTGTLCACFETFQTIISV